MCASAGLNKGAGVSFHWGHPGYARSGGDGGGGAYGCNYGFLGVCYSV